MPIMAAAPEYNVWIVVLSNAEKSTIWVLVTFWDITARSYRTSGRTKLLPIDTIAETPAITAPPFFNLFSQVHFHFMSALTQKVL